MTAEVLATRTYLEMTDRSALRPEQVPAGPLEVTKRHPCDSDFWRYLYSTVGEAYHWVDRLSWSETEIRAYLDDPAVSLWVMTVDGALAGYFELRMDPDRSDRDRLLRPAAAVHRTRARRLSADAGCRARLERRRAPGVAAHEQLRSSRWPSPTTSRAASRSSRPRSTSRRPASRQHRPDLTCIRPG